MTKYNEILEDLKLEVVTPAVAKRAAAAIEELVHQRQLDMAEKVRLRRWIERLEEDKCLEQ